PAYRPGASGSWRPSRDVGGRGHGPAAPPDRPFVNGDLADRGPMERPVVPAPLAHARDEREIRRQEEWREQAASAINTLRADEGTRPVNAEDLGADDEALADAIRESSSGGSEVVLRIEEPDALPTLRVMPFGISRKRLEQAIRELQLPVIVARAVDEADVVMTLRSEYRRKGALLREAEERAMPIYVLKNNTILQMQASLTSIFSLEVDPREAALRETEEAIGLVVSHDEPVELSPQNAYIRRLQHQMAEQANLVSRSRGREPYRRVRLYPDRARAAWR
ncbi:MAG TPA: R3H domain-containing nucleic acid-binding protein, partial [Candidatus Limnocylindrales bacterium]|nr:R3H domain-containing nucleic acid-binding protein [Candidatus Limnocylindrales bacterium]